MAINPGDIAFVGVNATDPDQFAFVVKNAIAGGDTFLVTDGGYTGATSGAASSYFRTSEGFLQYTAPAAGLPAGTVIVVAASTPSVSRNGGGAAGTVALLGNSNNATNNFTFSTSGDSLTAYTVTSGTHLTGTPTLIAFIGFGDSPYGAGTAQSSSTPTITNGQVLVLANLDNAIVKSNTPAYNLSITQLSAASNFNQQDTTRYDLTTISSIPTINLSLSSNTGTETGQTVITVTATASSAVSGNQTVNLAVTGTGITTGDYNLSSSTITILSGQTTGTATFTVVDDALVEGTETATLTISNPSSGITLGNTTSQNITITDNDIAANPTVNLSVSSNTGTEAGTTVITVTATASSAVSGNQTVNLAVTGTGITAGDYNLSSGTIAIANGQTTGSVTFTVVDDALVEGTETATLTISNPSSGIALGSTTTQNITIIDNDFANTAPTIQADNETIIDPEKVTAFLSIPNNSPAGSPAAYVSGVINDPTDPARTIGIEFNVADAETAAGSLTVTATSSNAAVVTNANLAITGTANSRNLKITPTGVGYSDITVTVSDGSLTSFYVIKYAASAAGATTSRFLTGASNASTAIALNTNYMLVGDDENQVLRLYDRNNSGLPVAGFDYTASLGLTDTSGGVPREVDIEASTKVGNRIFWMGSQSNTDPDGKLRPNRDRVFATDISGTGASTSLSYVGRYDYLREDIIAWDVNNGHGKGANYYGLAASAAVNVSSKTTSGYNIEGLEMAPDNTTAYVAFRAPQEPTGTRTKALIVPVTNFTSLLSGNGGTQGSATFGAPIELDLGGRGIREIRKNASNQYVIIAGAAGDTGAAPNDFRLYTWTGVATDAPVLRSADLTSLNVDGSFESIVELPSSLTSTSQLQLLVDNGSTVFYNDGQDAKSVTANYQKSRSEIVTLGNPIVKIHDIQGSGSTFNPSYSGSQSIEGIVTQAFQGATKLNGFYVQEEDADADNNAATSEAIFVYDPSGKFTGNVGDKVQVTGTVKEFTTTSGSTTSSLTELDATSGTVLNLGASTLPTVTNIQLPVTSVSDLERYEGMLVNVSAASGNLAVTEYYQLGRYGEVLLSATGASNQPGTDARLDQYTQFNAPSVSGYSAYLADIAKREIYLDDGSGKQNPDPIIFARGGNPLSATNTLRGGDTVASISGILDERFEGYRVQTSTGVNFTPTNPRPTAAPDVGSTATLKVASFNVLNYFNDLDTGSNITTNGLTFEPRGAETAAEFTRQRDKIIQAIIGSGADVLGLMELENNGYGSNSAIQDLVNGLNALAGAGTYSFINPGTSLGTDAIAVGLIYKSSKVTPVGAAATMPNGYGTGAFDLVGRKPLAQTFQQISTGEKFTAVINHFKSKGSSAGGDGDADAGDGQGFSNGTRTREAQDLAQWLTTKPTGTTDSDYLILGDLNAYAKEDPLTKLAQSGYNNLLSQTSYSYVFDGQTGSLDHALASTSLAAQVTGAEKWHINADEPSVLDYNTNFKTASQQTSLYNADPYRASDHDPVIIGLNLYSINNTITPAASRDPLTGTAGNDRIVGGAGAKTITGGAGNDQFVYTSLNDVGQRITDFEVGKDKIVLTQLLDSLVSGGYNGSDAITDGYVKLVQGTTANSTVLQIDRDGPLGSAIFRAFLTIDNVAPTAMSDIHNFVF